jgi:hypothetical protein
MKLFVGAGAFAASIGRGIADWLNDETPFGDHVSLGPFGGFTIPKLAMGGTITAGGYALVGEQGPEVVRLPTGATVAPNRAAQARTNAHSGTSAARGVFQGTDRPLVVQVMVGRRQIAEAVAEHMSDIRAKGG